MKDKQKLIYSSKDYSRFVQDDTNRNASKHPRLLTSMKKYGWLPEHPAVVVPDSGKFRIKDGGHRITIAKELGLTVFYVLSTTDDISIPDINSAQKTWTAADYIGAFIKQGNQEYIRLVAFANEMGLPFNTAAGLLSVNGISATEKIRSGEFRIKSEDHARSVMAIVGAAAHVVKWAKSQKFVSAISQILRHSRANPKVLCDKIRSHGGMLIPQITTDAMIEMLENIYNYRNREPISITLAVRQANRAVHQAAIAKATASRKSK